MAEMSRTARVWPRDRDEDLLRRFRHLRSLGCARHLLEPSFRRRQAQDLGARRRARSRAMPSRDKHRTEREQRGGPVADERRQGTGGLASRRRDVHARPRLVTDVETDRPGSRRLDDRPPGVARPVARAISHSRTVLRPSRLSIRARLLGATRPLDPRMAPDRLVARSSRACHSRSPGRRGRRLARRSSRRCAARSRLRRRRDRLRCGVTRGRREQPERIDVAVRIGSDANPEVDVWLVHLGRAARADRADDVLLGDRRAPGDGDRAEMRKRDRVAVRGLDRDRLAVRRHGPGEAHGAGRRCDDALAGSIGADVHASVLAGGVRLRLVIRKRLHDRPVHRPAPGVCGRCPDQEDKEKKRQPPDRCQNEQQDE